MYFCFFGVTRPLDDTEEVVQPRSGRTSSHHSFFVSAHVQLVIEPSFRAFDLEVDSWSLVAFVLRNENSLGIDNFEIVSGRIVQSAVSFEHLFPCVGLPMERIEIFVELGQDLVNYFFSENSGAFLCGCYCRYRFGPVTRFLTKRLQISRVFFKAVDKRWHTRCEECHLVVLFYVGDFFEAALFATFRKKWLFSFDRFVNSKIPHNGRGNCEIGSV